MPTSKYSTHPLKGRPSNHRTHGMSRAPEYRTWAAIHSRTTATKGEAFKNYASRGIRVEERWNKFESFYADMGPRPSSKHSIERVNNNGNYGPDNCVWALRKKQANNTRSNHLITFQGRTQTLAQWGDETGIKATTIWYRLKRYGWTLERALTAPFVPHKERVYPKDGKGGGRSVSLTYNGETCSISEWADKLNIPRSTLFNRRARGWPIERLLGPHIYIV